MLLVLDFGFFWASGGKTGFLSQICTAYLYYVDPYTGSNSNDGLGWATALYSLDGATAAMLLPGDSVLIAKTPDPTSIGDATWTAGLRTVTLAAACTQMIYPCEYAWQKTDANITSATYGTSRKEGTSCQNTTIGAGYTTGLAVSANLGADVDCAGYKQVSAWVRTSVILSANAVDLVLYSDNNFPPTTAVAVCNIPTVPTINLWTPMTWDLGVAIGTVRQVGLVVNVDPGVIGILIDDIIACKDSTSADSLTLTSLISKNTANEPWFALAWINGTSVGLESIAGNATPSLTLGSYGGATETVGTYKRETFKTSPAAATSTQIQAIQDSGTVGNPILFEGGYNTSSGARDGMTWYDGSNAYGYGIYSTGKSWVTLRYLGAARYYWGFTSAGTWTGLTHDNCRAAACMQYGIILNGTGTTNTLTNLTISGCGVIGVNMSIGIGRGGHTMSTATVHGSVIAFQISSSGDWTLTDCIAASGTGAAYRLSGGYSDISFVNCTSTGNSLTTYSAQMDGSTDHIKLINFTETGAATGAIYFGAQTTAIGLFDSSLGSSPEVTFQTTYGNDILRSTNHDDAPGSHYAWEYGATYNSTQAVRHTASGWAWQLSPTNTARASTWPLRLPIGQVYLAAGVATTVTAWMRRSNTGLTLSLVCPGGQITGVASDVSDSVAEIADTWEQMSITLTSTETGAVTVEAQAYGGSAYTGYVDDAGSDQTGTFTGLDNGTGAGPVWINSASAAGTRVAIGRW